MRSKRCLYFLSNKNKEIHNYFQNLLIKIYESCAQKFAVLPAIENKVTGIARRSI